MAGRFRLIWEQHADAFGTDCPAGGPHAALARLPGAERPRDHDDDAAGKQRDHRMDTASDQSPEMCLHFRAFGAERASGNPR
eukprot:scaffold48_cov311-Pinguiococcus_pyrenoidosus.AAC.52